MMSLRRRRDAGSASVELAILAPVILGLVALTVYAGRVTLARQAVDAAAFDAARTASIARTEGAARSTGRSAGLSTLGSLGLSCRSRDVSINASEFDKDPGEAGTVSARVSCTVDGSDLGLPGIPLRTRLTGTFTSPLDTYRGRG
ncbi:membrane protein [Actinoplanes sp. OR16]|uniref:TadE family protein n=1 Tax=Actinoplanes sp. OR16 TaxID=946334 RepID=UPI000F6B5DD0|nr:TadE/TadG family type IV pilus assembly protein [Actinoplanes sp. OR16]BBH67112.1 membrane protein [Actinoplanes sp. OR16]